MSRRRAVSSTGVLVGFVLLGLMFGATLSGARAVSPPAQIAYAGGGNLYLIGANGADRRVLVSGGPEFRVDEWGGLAWTRDARQIAFAVGDHMARNRYGVTLRIYLADGDGTNVRPLQGAPRRSFDPSWSPDGSHIAFSIRGVTETSIAVIGTDGTGLRKLVSSNDPLDLYWAPDWSPDGAWILFEMFGGHRGVPSRLMAVHADGTGLHQIAALVTGKHCICGDWSPDGSRIAYQAPGQPRMSPEYPEIWVMNADGTGRVQLSRNRIRDENPDWSPDAKRIAFYSERKGNAEIYVIRTEGIHQARRVTHDPWYTGAPRWRPSE